MDGVLRTERVVLLGLVTLLGATINVVAAVIALVVTIIAGLVVGGVGAIFRPGPVVPAGFRWAVLFVVGFGISWILGSLTPFVADVSQRTVFFVRLCGVAPIVFYVHSDETGVRESIVSWALFGILMVLTGTLREVFGNGTFLGYLVTPSFTIPADIFASPIGAFLVVSTYVLGARVIHITRNSSGVEA